MPRLNQSQNAYEFKNTLGRRQIKKKERPDPSRDNTTRGKIRQSVSKAYDSLLEFLEKILDISIVHINKLVLLALFLVSVSRPTVINAIIFIMLLILSMVDHNYELSYFRLTLFINSLAIITIFVFDVFIQRDLSTIRTWVLYIIGVQYRRENNNADFLKIKYLPYVLLQIVLVLCVYVFQSDKYKYFKMQYMDIETQKRAMIATHMDK
jgi:hypothetical protein